MKWRSGRRSGNVEDRRSDNGRRRRIGRGGGVGGLALIAMLLIGIFFGVDISPLIGGGGGEVSIPAGNRSVTKEDKAAGEFSAVVVGYTEEAWNDIFIAQLNGRYQSPTLVLYKDITVSPCGNASGATGPFYCPADKKVYLDTAFFTTLSKKMGAHGDFAFAYVIAHEIAHHVQGQMGILREANNARRTMSAADSNRVSVMIELQADCYSGIWARYMQETNPGILENGDIAEAGNAARQIGDDMLQRSSGRRPMPHTFTHGSSKQRQEWFTRGYKTGDIKQCDTFNAGL